MVIFLNLFSNSHNWNEQNECHQAWWQAMSPISHNIIISSNSCIRAPQEQRSEICGRTLMNFCTTHILVQIICGCSVDPWIQFWYWSALQCQFDNLEIWASTIQLPCSSGLLDLCNQVNYSLVSRATWCLGAYQLKYYVLLRDYIISVRSFTKDYWKLNCLLHNPKVNQHIPLLNFLVLLTSVLPASFRTGKLWCTCNNSPDWQPAL